MEGQLVKARLNCSAAAGRSPPKFLVNRKKSWSLEPSMLGSSTEGFIYLLFSTFGFSMLACKNT